MLGYQLTFIAPIGGLAFSPVSIMIRVLADVTQMMRAEILVFLRELENL